MLNVDIGCTDPYTRDVAEVRRRAREPGRAAAAYVYYKHARYRPEDNPTEDLVPFILESFGRPSTRAVNFLRQFAPTEPGARSRELRRAYRELSCLAQLRLAELLRSSLLFVRTYQTKRSDSCGKSGYLGEIQISTKSRGIFRYTSKR